MVTPVFGLCPGSLYGKNIYDHVNLPTSVDTFPQKISDIWLPNTKTWNNALISQIFDNIATSNITQTPVVAADSPDILRWKPGKKGSCTTKEAFNFLNQQLQAQMTTQGARGTTQQALHILQRAWKHKKIPPCIKTFTWRLIGRALATDVRAGNFSTKIDKHCTTCNLVENDSHLFFSTALLPEQFGSQPLLR